MVNSNDHSHYPKLEDNEVLQLLEDRIQFKLWSAQKHLDKLEKIEKKYGGIMGKNRIHAEDELDCYFAQIIGARDALLILINEKLTLNLSEKSVNVESIYQKLNSQNKNHILKEIQNLSIDQTSWYWILKEYRIRSIHRNILYKQVAVSLFENINNNTSSSTCKNYLLLPPDYKVPMQKETIVFLSECIKEMRKLIDTIKKDGGI